MKNALQIATAILLGLLVLSPLIAGFIDAVWWFFMDELLTHIKWESDYRYCIAAIWPMFWVTIYVALK